MKDRDYISPSSIRDQVLYHTYLYLHLPLERILAFNWYDLASNDFCLIPIALKQELKILRAITELNSDGDPIFQSLSVNSFGARLSRPSAALIISTQKRKHPNGY